MEWEVLTENPIISGLVVTVIGGTLAFFKPIMRALQAALIRRIDRAWPEDGGHEERVRKTVEKVQKETMMPLPRKFVESAVRAYKSIPPIADGKT